MMGANNRTRQLMFNSPGSESQYVLVFSKALFAKPQRMCCREPTALQPQPELASATRFSSTSLNNGLGSGPIHEPEVQACDCSLQKHVFWSAQQRAGDICEVVETARDVMQVRGPVKAIKPGRCIDRRIAAPQTMQPGRN